MKVNLQTIKWFIYFKRNVTKSIIKVSTMYNIIHNYVNNYVCYNWYIKTSKYNQFSHIKTSLLFRMLWLNYKISYKLQ